MGELMYRSKDPYIDATVHEYCVLLLHWLALLPQKKECSGSDSGLRVFLFCIFSFGVFVWVFCWHSSFPQFFPHCSESLKHHVMFPSLQVRGHFLYQSLQHLV